MVVPHSMIRPGTCRRCSMSVQRCIVPCGAALHGSAPFCRPPSGVVFLPCLFRSVCLCLLSCPPPGPGVLSALRAAQLHGSPVFTALWCSRPRRVCHGRRKGRGRNGEKPVHGRMERGDGEETQKRRPVLIRLRLLLLRWTILSHRFRVRRQPEGLRGLFFLPVGRLPVVWFVWIRKMA